MLERVYQRQNRNRRHPCVESKTDMFRVLQYDINKAAGEVENRRPLLLTRHNVVPGMVLVSDTFRFVNTQLKFLLVLYCKMLLRHTEFI